MSDLELLIKVLTVSVNKHGKDTPVTLGHLLNIVKMVKKNSDKVQDQQVQAEEDAYENYMQHVHNYGVGD